MSSSYNQYHVYKVRAGGTSKKAPERSHSAFRGVDINSRGTTRFSRKPGPQPPLRLWQITMPTVLPYLSGRPLRSQSTRSRFTGSHQLPYGFGYYRFTGTAPGSVYTAPSSSACTHRRLSEDEPGLSSPHLCFYLWLILTRSREIVKMFLAASVNWQMVVQRRA